MKSLIRTLVATLALTCLTAYSCGQNGPTTPSVALTWTQSTSTGVTANCIYRGTVAGTYTLPALYCSTAPITSYTDTTVVRGSAYHYAVTAQVGTEESAYSNDAAAAVPAINPPTLGTPKETKLTEPGDKGLFLTAKVIYK